MSDLEEDSHKIPSTAYGSLHLFSSTTTGSANSNPVHDGPTSSTICSKDNISDLLSSNLSVASKSEASSFSNVKSQSDDSNSLVEEMEDSSRDAFRKRMTIIGVFLTFAIVGFFMLSALDPSLTGNDLQYLSTGAVFKDISHTKLTSVTLPKNIMKFDYSIPELVSTTSLEEDDDEYDDDVVIEYDEFGNPLEGPVPNRYRKDGLNPTKSPSYTPKPSYSPSFSYAPTRYPVYPPTNTPTKSPRFPPTHTPSIETTAKPTKLSPTQFPTKAPGPDPTFYPTKSPRSNPTEEPTKAPRISPTDAPTKSPSHIFPYALGPTNTPTNLDWTDTPTKAPRYSPTYKPTKSPVIPPTHRPISSLPTYAPTTTVSPTTVPYPTAEPTYYPTKAPRPNPTQEPTVAPVTRPPTKSPADKVYHTDDDDSNDDDSTDDDFDDDDDDDDDGGYDDDDDDDSNDDSNDDDSNDDDSRR